MLTDTAKSIVIFSRGTIKEICKLNILVSDQIEKNEEILEKYIGN